MGISKRSVARLAVLGGAAWVGLLVAPAIGRAAGTEDKALPGSTIAFIKVDNAAKLRQAFKASQIGKMIADPGMDAMKKDIRAKLEDSGKKVKETLGVSINELLTIPQGPITIAVVGREVAEGKSAVVLLATADAGENADKMADVMGRATKEAETKGGKVATETFKDIKLTIIRKDENDKEPLIWAKAGSVFHIASDLDALKDRISNASGRTDSLASNENYQAVLKGVGADSHALLFIDVAQAIKLGIASNPGGNAAQLEAQLQLTGINGFKGMGASFSFDKGDYDQVAKVFFYSPGPAQGILKIFSMPPIDLKPPAWVPASVQSYQSFSWDLDAAWKAVVELADQNGLGGFIDQAQRGIGPNGDFDFKKDVFGPLGNRIIAISDVKKPITEKSQRTLFAVALDDEKAFTSTFSKVLTLTQAAPKKRDFQGTTIYDFEIPALPQGAQMNIDGPISVAIAKGNLFVSTEPTLLEQILRSGAPALADNADFQTVVKKLPAKNSILSFDRTEEQARLIYEMIKGGGLQKALDQAAANNGGQAPKNPIDPTKIPEFSVFAKYLGQGGSFGIMDEQGVTITSFILRKAAP